MGQALRQTDRFNGQVDGASGILVAGAASQPGRAGGVQR